MEQQPKEYRVLLQNVLKWISDLNWRVLKSISGFIWRVPKWIGLLTKKRVFQKSISNLNCRVPKSISNLNWRVPKWIWCIKINDVPELISDLDWRVPKRMAPKRAKVTRAAKIGSKPPCHAFQANNPVSVWMDGGRRFWLRRPTRVAARRLKF